MDNEKQIELISSRIDDIDKFNRQLERIKRDCDEKLDANYSLIRSLRLELNRLSELNGALTHELVLPELIKAN